MTNGSGGIIEESDFYPFGGERIIVNNLDNNYKFTPRLGSGQAGHELKDYLPGFENA